MTSSTTEDLFDETILLVEDEPDRQESLIENLQRNGYHITLANSGHQALKTVQQEQPNLILLNVTLPSVDGFEVCRLLRQESNIPIIMLSARDSEIDKVVGLEVGADDYVTKPYSIRELLARIRSHLRRVRLIEAEFAQSFQYNDLLSHHYRLIHLDDLVIDREDRRVKSQERWFHLKPLEFELLMFFVRHIGIVLSREQIFQNVWRWEYAANSRTVDVHVRWLREKIEQDSANPKRIVTMRRIGYRFDG